MELSKDLTTPVSEVRTLWKATDYLRVKSVSKRKEGYVTDGPFLYRNKQDELICIWSSLLHSGYAQLYSKSSNGDSRKCLRIKIAKGQLCSRQSLFSG